VPIQGGIGRDVRRVDGAVGGGGGRGGWKDDEGRWDEGGRGECIGGECVVSMVRGVGGMGWDASEPDVYYNISVKPEGGTAI